VLKAALNAAVREARTRNAAFRDVKPFKSVDAARKRYLTDDEAKRLVNAVDPAFRPLVQAALLTGARYGDLRKARVRDFDVQAGLLTFPSPKGGRAHRAYLDADGVALCKRAATGKRAGDLLFPRTDGRAWGPSEQARPLAAACEAASIERATFHDLRRTYGARLARQGVQMAVIAEALGHADLRMTMKHYAHLAPSYVADTIRQHIGGMGLVEADNVTTLASRRAS
jgi:integrase